MVMFDYNLSNHWADDEPVWIKSLASSLYRRHDEFTVLPLPLAVDEIVNWVHLASGEDAWAKKQNRESLAADLDQSAKAVGNTLRLIIDGPLRAFQRALVQLDASPKALLREPPGSRTAAGWTDVLREGADLLTHLNYVVTSVRSYSEFLSSSSARWNRGLRVGSRSGHRARQPHARVRRHANRYQLR